MISTSRHLLRQSPTSSCSLRRFSTVAAARPFKNNTTHHPSNSRRLISASAAAAGIGAATVVVVTTSYRRRQCHDDDDDVLAAKCSVKRIPSNADVLMLAPQKEPSTGILFPGACNGMRFVGCGVRVKWHFVKVYAVGTYVDPLSMAAVKKQSDGDIEKSLLDPNYPRTIRIVMNRTLSIEKYTSAIVEALEPRMEGVDLDKLEEFKMLNPSIDLVEGAEMEMTIRGDTMLYKNAVGGMGMIQSDVFCRALCDVYYGKDAVSPSHKEDVIKGIKGL
eukprot:CAMPEP_0172488150 /NCGR_PEP_ID=MMETSP1066-20121228/17547_1 /TAXON_ID=671091 /ORGANISM="Coscinodiscus wailesii, Strain CCMP2513" /LENGTH=275 /DNA_ID=CAMNT_0013255193 /DNA_START=48 /DNA_END=875 /DNA_ORIENTATION=+